MLKPESFGINVTVFSLIPQGGCSRMSTLFLCRSRNLIRQSDESAKALSGIITLTSVPPPSADVIVRLPPHMIFSLS